MKHVRNVTLASTAFISLLLTGSVASAATVGETGAAHVALPNAKILPQATTTYTSGDTPTVIRHAYGFDLLPETGAGQTIALIEAYGSPTIANDLATFDTQFGLPAANLTVATPQGTPTTNGGWALETALDVEWAHAIAPQANLLVVEAKSASTTDLVSAIDYASSHGAQVVSNSWGGGETSTESSYDSHFQSSGTVYVASAGDNGGTAEWPAVSGYMLSTGINLLTLDANGNYLSETGQTPLVKSVYESTPSYQMGLNLGTSREVPDVSVGVTSNAAAVYDSTPDSGSTGWFACGGTSFSAPVWAGLVALADQNRTTRFSSLQLITDLYNLKGSTYFHVGGGTGPSGVLGSPKADKLVPALITAP